jgi:hypothetical protein
LKPKEREEVMSWMQDLKFPDGYAVGFTRDVNLETWKVDGLKSHDYYIFMERLLPIMFRCYLNDDMWTALAELSYFYRQPSAKEIKKEMMKKLEKEIPMFLCKLKKNLPSRMVQSNAIFTCHLLYEPKIGGPQ